MYNVMGLPRHRAWLGMTDVGALLLRIDAACFSAVPVLTRLCFLMIRI